MHLRAEIDEAEIVQFSKTEMAYVGTRVLQVIYFVDPGELPALPGQQVDLFIEAAGENDHSRSILNNLSTTSS